MPKLSNSGDLGYRGVDADNPDVEILHRAPFKSMTNQQRRWRKRRQAIEPAIGHLKADHRMNRCWLAGSLGDALHAVLCAAGYNLRWLLRAIARGRIRRFFFALLLAALQAMFIASALSSSSKKRPARGIARERCDSRWLPGVAAAG